MKTRLMNNSNHSQTQATRPFAPAFCTPTEPLINTVASARWKDALSTRELFQQFIESSRKPLKRLVGSSTSPHRAKAPVLLRTCWDASALCGLAAALLLAGTGTALPDVHYVDVISTNATPPYTNWATAATILQDAVDAAVPGDQIVVTNGVYASGSRNGNRVEVAKAVSLHSINGPQVTVISGTNSSGWPENRCVYLPNSARLSGFSLSCGVRGDVNSGASRLNCESVTAVASNCTISACTDGAASGGTLNHCTLSGNSASDNHVTDSGGTVDCLVNNCLYFATFHEVFSRLVSKRFYRARLQ